MKQARKVRGGGNRRGRAKRRGRNEGEPGMLIDQWTPRADAAKRDETPRKVLRRESGRARTEGTLEENEAHERMNPVFHETRGPVSTEDHLGPPETARQ